MIRAARKYLECWELLDRNERLCVIQGRHVDAFCDHIFKAVGATDTLHNRVDLGFGVFLFDTVLGASTGPRADRDGRFVEVFQRIDLVICLQHGIAGTGLGPVDEVNHLLSLWRGKEWRDSEFELFCLKTGNDDCPAGRDQFQLYAQEAGNSVTDLYDWAEVFAGFWIL